MAEPIYPLIVERFRGGAARELRPQLDEFESTSVRLKRLRELGIKAGFLVHLRWGNVLPHPKISQTLLETASDMNAAINWLSAKITIDETDGCWALPLPVEHDDKNRARYPSLTGKEFGAKGELAHRFVVRRLLGSLATEEHLDHICRAHACCNPMHLEVVTHTTNVRRGRYARSMTEGQIALLNWQGHS